MYNGVYPAYIRPYTQVKPKTVQQKGDEEKSSNSSANQEARTRNPQSQVRASNFQLSGYRNIQSQVKSEKAAQTINVSQILTDFKGTATAVGAPKEVLNEVYTYLGLIEAQAKKETPNKKIIQSNLKNASQVLDGYITSALKTPSNVVENWIDALFLQNIDYKADPNAINEDFKINLDGNKSEEAVKPADKEVERPEQNGVEPSVKNYVPSDEKMKSLFVTAKKTATQEDFKPALISLKKALDYAVKTDDKKIQSMIYYETADVYNKNGLYPQALKGYKIAADIADDENLIAKSYMKTGRIYDEAGLFKPAAEHWISAIGYAGESENLALQVKALGNLADAHSEVYDSKMAYTYTTLANGLAEETKNEKVKGYSYKRASEVSEQLEDNSKALKYLKLSTKSYAKAQDSKKVIDNYISAADIMIEVGNPSKARALLNKAYLTAIDNNRLDILRDITGRIAKIAA